MLDIKNLNKFIKNNHILKDISFHVDTGDILAIIGPSGSGKTTLLRCLNYLEMPNNGTLGFCDGSFNLDFSKHIDKKDILKLRRKMGMVFQSYNLFPHKTALENVTEGLIVVQKIHKDEAEHIALEILKKVGLSDKINLYPSSLSGGQQQRVAIARAVALNPDILLLDEPTSALDKELVGEVLSTLKLLAKEKQTMVVVTHELNFAKDVANKIMFLEGGEIITIENPKEFFENQKNPRILRFLGNLSAN
ncbi:amino acid ABC transporter ATP-binding protein [Campylobacter fetus]|uniref:Amino acid ABC transporter ATPase n=1 Tax=Campylobacter fetus subsp. testudinum TaxID=1507806 RepID=A0AAX0HCL0_CAMFE|nr:amino acid ABC transporter ATP-binding protein [Campylobacter fetus]AGZ81637.1 amino acid ABC transporter, ATP-binding protein [Campylobacter fetus subsp. testudinum 03-427]AJB45377.1 amino acid ABC transporter ATPase [Campylobacter fetus subsp. testudinum]ALV64796.1 amino acid ABC transporter, ATP-binding protein [Campylobacter fetus subsp. testudinum Sp3]AVK81043.1 amino acid ABC transporter ATP-binding protein [Campylobacter fetus subsp. testudinum]EAI4321386.1 amino acid ABC transporter